MTEGLRLDGLTRRYANNVALDRITLSIPDNEYIALLGPSGSGKTVLLRVIAGFEQPDAGAIWFGGKRLDTAPAHLRGIGFVFQNFALFPHLNVRDNVGFGLTNRAVDPLTDPKLVRTRVAEMIELVGLTGLEDRGVAQISGGQRQRVALARTLVTQPKLVLLDEPLGALDANLRTRMRGELKRIRGQLGVTFLHVTGSETEALAMGDRVIVLDRGRIGQFADPGTVYNEPASANVAGFLNCYNIFPGQVVADRFLAGSAAFDLGRMPPRSGTPAYCIRQDLIAIRGPDARAAPGEAAVPARFVTSEYSGASVTYFFEMPDGRAAEVEAHLGHRKPEELVPDQTYTLVWETARAVVFA